ncbi:hypothetical protein [Curtobacterium sp. ISL-83]|uniref:hypothetical protein n=1 Tax=Curtobacterium sp. ISL-83 TaxID=2819145 RepID=UPI001BE939F4|nr:hypothetical protein [Curtobacterium sp. ISL-83]MBT2501033.1 hypothetical protein [Curtobacterium sp. ISL-83]
MDACAELARLAADVAEQAQSPRDFLVRLGRAGAGIRRGPLGILDLARGGRNTVRGTGFRSEYDDGTLGQVRHFAGTAAGAARFGPALTLWLSVHVTRDDPESPDGRLSALAVSFARDVRAGVISPGSAPDWITTNVCAVTGRTTIH